MPDDYSGGIRSQLLRNAVANGDAGRVVNFYKGFQQAGHAPAGQHGLSRQRHPATGGPRIYTRQQIAEL
jgi:hypothetical protein